MRLRVSRATCKRWLRAWSVLGVSGVHRVPSVGREGWCYVADASLVDRYAAGELPPPRLP